MMATKSRKEAQTLSSKDVIRALCKIREWTQADLAYEMGYASQAGVGQILSDRQNSKKGMALSTYERAIDALGAEIIVRDKMGSGKEWRIDDLLLRESIDCGAKSGKAD